MKTLFVISGAAGMTGSELSRQAVRRGDCVIGFDNFFASSAANIDDILGNEQFLFFEWDINHEDEMERLADEVRKIRGGGYECLVYVNCAAVVHTEYFYHVDSTFDTNVLGMARFLRQSVAMSADCFINCSSSEVYSMDSYREGGVTEEDFILMATAEHSQRTSYAAGKLMTEFFLKDAVDRRKIKGCSLRFANVYSKNERYAKHIIPHIITSLLKDGKVTLLENSRVNRRTFLHNIDSCGAILALTDKPEALDGTVYNVATMEEVTITELVELCAKELGIEKPEILFEGYRESDPERRLLSSEKLTKRTGWIPSVSLKEGIRLCVECYRMRENSV